MPPEFDEPAVRDIDYTDGGQGHSEVSEWGAW